jgi:pimeloyl-ACP methyl ester carboxylesterase
VSFLKTKDDVHLYYKRWGAGQPVVLIHGWPLSSDTWDFVAMRLAQEGFETVAYDRRGFGRSEQPWSGYDYDTLSDDLGSVIDELGLDDAVICGFSMGGGEIARYLSRHDGKHVRAAVLVSSVVPYMTRTEENPDGVPNEVFDQLRQGLRKDRPAFLADFFEDFYGNGTDGGGVSDEVVAWSRNVAMQGSLKATLECVTSFGETDFRPDLEAFDVPTLVIHGTNDQIVPIGATGKVVADQVEDARLVTYDGAPHGVLATHRTEIADDLLTFLGGL